MEVLAVFGITNDGLNLAVNLLLLFLVVFWIALVYWTYADARRRIEDPMLVGCATAASLFPFAGTVVYTIVRPPEYLEDVHERQLEIAAAQARLHEMGQHSCPYCDYEIEKSFLRCPSCLRRLREPCATCGKPLDPRWKICPYCEAEIASAPVPQAAQAVPRRRAAPPPPERPVRERPPVADPDPPTRERPAANPAAAPATDRSAARRAARPAARPERSAPKRPAPKRAERPAAPREERPAADRTERASSRQAPLPTSEQRQPSSPGRDQPRPKNSNAKDGDARPSGERARPSSS